MTATQTIESVDTVWRDGLPPRPPSPALERDLTVDAAIIGGGLSGMSTAYHLLTRHPHLQVALLEAASLGFGASGRNGGLVLTGLAGSSPRTIEAIRRDYLVTKEAIDDLEHIIRSHGLDVPFGREGALQSYTSEAGAKGAAEMVARYREAGIELQLLDRGGLGDWITPVGTLAGVIDPAGGRINSLAYIRALADLLIPRGLQIFEGTKVLSMDPHATDGCVRLTTPNGLVTARAIFVCLNAFTPSVGLFRRSIIPVHSYVVATAPGAEDRWREAGWQRGVGFDDDQPRLAYASMTHRGSVVFGGGSNAAYAYRYGSGHILRGDHSASFAAVIERMHGYFPKVADVPIAHRWSGAIGMTLTRMCTMGVLGEHKNIYYAAGFSGHGIVTSTLSGRVLADLYDGQPGRWEKMPFYQYRPPPFPPEPLRWLGYQAYTRLTGRSPRREYAPEETAT